MDFVTSVYLSEAQNPIPTPTLCIRVYMQVYLLTQGGGGGGGESWNREKGRGATQESTDPKAGLKMPTWLNVHKKLAISSL